MLTMPVVSVDFGYERTVFLHQVINGYSELMRDVFGPEAGVGARSAVGMILPHDIATEIEAIWEVHDENSV